jgi:hypothetical protein
MSSAPDPLTPYRAVVAKVDAFWDRVVSAQPEAFACAPGCASCCLPGLSVHPVEAMAIRAHLATWPPQAREALGDPAHTPTAACAFLREDRCAIYPVRPVICHSHGLPVRIDGRVDACPLNFRNASWSPEAVLDLEHLNLLLALANREALRLAQLPLDTPRAGAGSCSPPAMPWRAAFPEARARARGPHGGELYSPRVRATAAGDREAVIRSRRPEARRVGAETAARSTASVPTRVTFCRARVIAV